MLNYLRRSVVFHGFKCNVILLFYICVRRYYNTRRGESVYSYTYYIRIQSVGL